MARWQRAAFGFEADHGQGDVGLRKTGGCIEYAVQGTHDSFPNCTLKINGNQVYVWACVSARNDPAALGPLVNQTIYKDWRTL